MKYDDVLTRFDAVTRRGDTAMARCPHHPDKTASLSISMGDNGRTVCRCHAGCDTRDVLASVGLKLGDLFDTTVERIEPQQRRQVATYDYTDENGQLLYQVVRYEPKGFTQRRPDGQGGWHNKLGDVRRVLYRLPQIKAAIEDGAPIWLVEGEKDVAALEREGEIATTACGGAGKWRPDYNTTLKDAHVIVCGDDDDPGNKYANNVVTQLASVAASVERRLPAAGFKDIAEHLGAGLALGELRTTPPLVDTNNDTEQSRPLFHPINWQTFWAENHEDQQWLVEPVLPIGRQVAIYSVAKTGKSLITLEMAAAKATGRPVLLSPAEPPINVVYIDQEMTAADLKDRLEEMGYGPETDLGHLHYYQLQALPPLDTAEGGEAVENLVRYHDAKLVAIDTMARVVQGDENDADTYRNFYRHTGLRIKGLGVTMARLDHAGKDAAKGQRGASAKNDDVDIVFRLSCTDAETRTTFAMKATHMRINLAQPDFTLKRLETPHLHHVVEGADTYPAGTGEVATLLDEYDVAVDATVRTAKQTLNHHGAGRRTTLITAALRYRRHAQTLASSVSVKAGNTRTAPPGNTNNDLDVF